MTRRARVLAAVLTAVACLVGAAAVAVAHTRVTSTSPKAGASASRSLRSATVTFSQQPRSGALRIYRAGRQVSVGGGKVNFRNVRQVRTSLRRSLRRGRYTARWSITSADGHRQSGSWSFKVR